MLDPRFVFPAFLLDQSMKDDSTDNFAPQLRVLLVLNAFVNWL